MSRRHFIAGFCLMNALTVSGCFFLLLAVNVAGRGPAITFVLIEHVFLGASFWVCHDMLKDIDYLRNRPSV